MVDSIFGIDFPRLDEAERFVKSLEIILCADPYISFAMKPIERLDALHQQVPANSQPPRGRETYDPAYGRFYIGNSRRDNT